jgi:hypothetical protein
MPDPERLLRTLHQAHKAFGETSGRHGRLILPDTAADILVAGDLHGNLTNFQRVLARADLGNHADRHLVFQELVHGPFRYPDGSDKSHQLIDVLAALKCQYPNRVHMLLGNHELAQWTNQWIAKAESDLNELFRAGIEFAYGPRAADVHDAYLKLFAAFPLAVRTPNRVFLSHSLPSAARLPAFDAGLLRKEESEPDELTPGGWVYALVWGRDTNPETAAAFLHKVDADWLISGHIPCDKGYDVPNDRQIILDSLGTPACCCLFPTRAPVTLQELIQGIQTL